MSGVERVVEVAAPAPVVWSIVEDLSRMPELSQSTISVEGPDRLTEVGQRFAQVVRLAGKRFRSEWTLLELHPGRFLRVEGVMAGLHRSPFRGSSVPRVNSTGMWATTRARFPCARSFKTAIHPLRVRNAKQI